MEDDISSRKRVRLVEGGLLSGWLIRRRLAAARPFLGGRILDFACGHGELAGLCDPTFYVGYDIDPRKLGVAREHFPDHRFESSLPDDQQYDTVVALAFIEHVECEPYLRQFASLLTDQGQIVLTTPHPNFEWIHTAGSKVGIFSSTAHDEHEALLSPWDMRTLAGKVSLDLAVSRRFLLGANQLFVLKKRAQP